MKLNYTKIDNNHNPIIKNFYLYDDGRTLYGLFLVSKIKDKLYFIVFKGVDFDSQEFKSYLQGNLQDANNPDASWFWTKYLLSYLDHILEKPVQIKPINSLKEISSNDNQQGINLYEIQQANFTNVGFAYEMVLDDLLEVVVKFLYQDKKSPFLSVELRQDFLDTQAWILENIYDQG